jgi:hypothetical protein
VPLSASSRCDQPSLHAFTSCRHVTVHARHATFLSPELNPPGQLSAFHRIQVCRRCPPQVWGWHPGNWVCNPDPLNFVAEFAMSSALSTCDSVMVVAAADGQSGKQQRPDTALERRSPETTMPYRRCGKAEVSRQSLRERSTARCLRQQQTGHRTLSVRWPTLTRQVWAARRREPSVEVCSVRSPAGR